jgi:hypothetical protein
MMLPSHDLAFLLALNFGTGLIFTDTFLLQGGAVDRSIVGRAQLVYYESEEVESHFIIEVQLGLPSSPLW